MSLELCCNGCGSRLYRYKEKPGCKQLVVEGKPVVGTTGIKHRSPLPQEEFHWCEDCAYLAFEAVENHSAGHRIPEL